MLGRGTLTGGDSSLAVLARSDMEKRVIPRSAPCHGVVQRTKPDATRDPRGLS